MLLKVHHTTRYQFDEPVHFGLQKVRKTPKSTIFQNVKDWQTTVEGGRKELHFEDHHQNLTELLSCNRDTRELLVICNGLVELHSSHGVVGPHRGPCPLWLYRMATPRTEAGPGVQALVKSLDKDAPELEWLHALSQVIGSKVAYEVGSSEADWTAEDALTEQRGVCQDHTHVFLACARHWGIPARYVSGYLMLDDRVAQDAMHAWAEAYVQDIGWVGFDVSNGISPDLRYVRVATGLDYSEASPVSGTRTGGGTEALDVRIEVAQQ